MDFKEFREEVGLLTFSQRHVLKLRSLLFDYFLSGAGSRGTGRMTMAQLTKDVEIYAETDINEETIRRFTMGYIWDKEDRNVSRATLDAVLRFCIECEEIEFDLEAFQGKFAEGVSLDGWPSALMRMADNSQTMLPTNIFGHFWHQHRDAGYLAETFLHIEPTDALTDLEAGCFADAKLQILRIHDAGDAARLTSIRTSVGKLLYTTDGVVFGVLKDLAKGANSFVLSISEIDESDECDDPELALIVQGEPEVEQSQSVKITSFGKISTKYLTERVKYYRKSLREIKKDPDSLFPHNQFRFSREKETSDFTTFLGTLAEKEGLAQNDKKGREAMPKRKTLREEFELKDRVEDGLERAATYAVRKDNAERLRKLIDQGITGNHARNNTLFTILHEAAFEDARECIRLLIKADIRYDLRTHDGKLASELTTDRAVKRLLEIKERRDNGRADVHYYADGATWETRMAYYKASELQGAKDKVTHLERQLEVARNKVKRLGQKGTLGFRALENG